MLHSSQRAVTFPQVQRSIDRLYRLHPAIRTFVARDVQYTPTTRDQVLGVCRRGGASKTAQTREATKIAGCAPLVFFFYRYGRQADVGDSIEVARNVYWYAVDNVRGPFDARSALTRLLDSWGIP